MQVAQGEACSESLSKSVSTLAVSEASVASAA
jgi:hypothetical protein